MTLWLVLGAGVLLLAVWGLLERRRRRRLVARLRAEWGRPMQRDRDMEAIAHYHWAFAEAAEEPLDERTGKDLDLDAVFKVLDRTESPVGQQLLYHRLRTTPTAANRTAFEALTARLGENASERERLQASLFRLRQYAGDVWWLTQPGVLDTRRVDVVFPFRGARRSVCHAVGRRLAAGFPGGVPGHLHEHGGAVPDGPAPARSLELLSTGGTPACRGSCRRIPVGDGCGAPHSSPW